MFFVGTDPSTFELFDPVYNGKATPADFLDTSTRTNMIRLMIYCVNNLWNKIT